MIILYPRNLRTDVGSTPFFKLAIRCHIACCIVGRVAHQESLRTCWELEAAAQYRNVFPKSTLSYVHACGEKIWWRVGGSCAIEAAALSAWKQKNV